MNIERKLALSIGARRSIRRYRREPIERKTIERLLLAATRAPSPHNRQPWRFAVVEDDLSKRELAQAMGERLRADRKVDGDDMTAIDADIARSHARIEGAPVVIVVCIDMEGMDRYPDSRRIHAEYLMAVQSAAMAAQNLLLAAHTEGLGVCIMCAPLFCPDTVVETLKLARGWTPQMLLTLGMPSDGGRDRPRAALDEIVRWLPRGAVHRRKANC
jgi:coenzyme F420-0:L-glutamate ligase / coenzyme F420-1:gamma-L-glutamate ligase